MKTPKNQKSTFLRIIKLPLRALGKARDFYVRSITDYAVYADKITGMGASNPAAELPKRSAESEDLRELIRAASGRALGRSEDFRWYTQQKMTRCTSSTNGAAGGRMRRNSFMGRIDEEKPCVFGEDNVDLKKGFAYPRSRSYAE